MYALDGQGPRFMNIWPYASTDARAKARADSVAQGVWPPKGGPAHLTTLHSAIFLPAPNSPLR
ncbi:NIPSNAP family protein [Thauera humireducens]